MRSPMRGKYDLACPDCEVEHCFVVEAVGPYDLEVVFAARPCDCPNKPDEAEALEDATEDFMDRIGARKWKALYGRRLSMARR